MASIGWKELSHAQLTEALSAGLAERDRRITEMMALTGERRGPGRPAGSGNKTARELQLEEAAAAESAGVQ